MFGGEVDWPVVSSLAARFRSDGRPDTTFGTNGIQLETGGRGMGIGPAAGLPDGSIIAQAFRYGDTPGRREALLVRYRP